MNTERKLDHMMNRKLLSAISCLLFCWFAIGQPSGFLLAKESSLEFELQSTEMQIVELFENAEHELVVVSFLGVDCPLSRLYAKRLNDLSQQFASSPIRFVAVDSNQHDSLDEIAQFAKATGLRFPFVKDLKQRLALGLDVQRNPEVVVLNRKLQVKYQGRIDDQYAPGISRDKPTSSDLHDALEGLLKGEMRFAARTQSVGCRITFSENAAELSEFTYCRDIQPILRENCLECHQTGEIAPFALTDYDEVVGWGEMLIEVIDQHRMPPWHAEDNVEFANARSMPKQAKSMLRAWVAGGMPFGDLSDAVPDIQVANNPLKDEDRFDLKLSMNEDGFNVPVEGTIDYQYFVVDPKFETDRWVAAASVIPGNRAVLHHAIVFIRPPDENNIRDSTLLTAYVPGQKNYSLPDGHAQLVKAGSHFVFQMHYTPNGIAQTDKSAVALRFMNESEVTHLVESYAALEQDFEIPPQKADHAVSGRLRYFPKDGRLLAVAPHMHLRGKAFELDLSQGDRQENLLRVPHYDFNWQHNYIYKNSVDLKSVDKIHFTAHFDNSPSNPHNPDPSEFVTWGDQTWEEMAIVFLTIARPRTVELPTAQKRQTNIALDVEAIEEQQRERWTATALERLARLDKNNDKRISKDEVPREFLLFMFDRADLNNDGLLDLDELIEQVSRRN